MANEKSLTEAAMEQGSKISGQAQLKAEVFSADDVDIEDFEFPEDLDDLDQDVKRAEKLLSVDNPNPKKAGKKINFLVRSLTPGEYGTITGSILPKAFLRDTLKEVFGSDNPEKVDFKSKEFQGKLAEKLSETDLVSENLNQGTDKKMYTAIVMGTVKPTLTVERISKWNHNLLELLYSTIMEELAARDAVWMFPEVGKE